MKHNISKIFAVALIVGMNYAGFFAVGRTAAMFNDTEVSTDNYFSAGSLDFTATPSSFEQSIDAGESVRFSVTLDKASSTIPFRQGGHFEWLTVEDRALCSAMELMLVASSTQLYRGSLSDFSYPATNTIGTLDFEIIATTTRSAIPYGEKCKFNFVFDATQESELQSGGFSDTEMVEMTLTARRGVVLNEFLPNPTGSDSADKPNGEWVELYNNGDFPRDLSGWYTRDSTDGEGNRVFVTTSNTLSATTTIASHGWLVVYMNKAILNNTGDTVRLFDNSDNLIDSHSYGIAPVNKSFARIPDGIGEWVDPIPTPGEPNREEEMVLNDTTIVADSDVATTTTEEVEVANDDTQSTTLSTEETESASTDPGIVPETAVAEESISEIPALVPTDEPPTIIEPIIPPDETILVLQEEVTPLSN